MIKKIFRYILSFGLIIYAGLSCLALVLSMLAEYELWDWVPFISVFGIGFLYCFLHLALVVTILIFRKKWFWTSFSLFLLFLGSNTLGRYYHNDRKIDTTEKTYSVLSLNMGRIGFSKKEVKDNLNKTAELIQKENPDIIFLQEYWHQKDIYKSFSQKLENVGYHYSTQNGSLKTYSKAEISIVKKLKYKHQYFGLISDVLLNDSTKIRTYNLHLQSNRVSKTLKKVKNDTIINDQIDHSKKAVEEVNSKRKSRLQQAEVILHKVKSSPYPILIGGDFNSTPHSTVYRKFENVVDDHFCLAGSGLGTSYNKIPLLKIDYLFSNEKELKPIHHKVIRNLNLSDHDPIISHFTVLQ